MRIGEIRKNDAWKRENAAHGEFLAVISIYWFLRNIQDAMGHLECNVYLPRTFRNQIRKRKMKIEDLKTNWNYFTFNSKRLG